MGDARRYAGMDGAYYLRHRDGAVKGHVQSLRATLFEDLCSDECVLMDFGCGTGGVLARLSAQRKIGVEIGAEAADRALSDGIEVFDNLDEIPTESIDVAISFHAIEHVDNPLSVLQGIGRVVKPAGRIRLIVPCETPLLRRERQWVPNQDRHLFTWTPLLFGNLAERAGFREIEVDLQPMPTASRVVRGLAILPPIARLVHMLKCLRGNRLNVILNARPPKATQ